MKRDTKTLVLVLGLVAALISTGCSATVGLRSQDVQGSSGPNPPKIDGAFAVSSMWLGKNWEIFVEGSDLDGDMDYIWAEVSQLGGHMWDQHLIRLKGVDRERFKGVIIVPTPSFQSRKIYETLRVTLRVRDRAGHYSNPVTLEVDLGKPTREAVPESWVDARKHRLGIIFFDFDLDRSEDIRDFKT